MKTYFNKIATKISKGEYNQYIPFVIFIPFLKKHIKSNEEIYRNTITSGILTGSLMAIAAIYLMTLDPNNAPRKHKYLLNHHLYKIESRYDENIEKRIRHNQGREERRKESIDALFDEINKEGDCITIEEFRKYMN